MKTKTRKAFSARSPKGFMGATLFCAAIFIVLGIGSFAVDVSRVSMVKTELQNAVEAAALSGASFLDIDANEANRVATIVAGRNYADGKPVSRNSTDTSVMVRVIDSQPDKPGRVVVQARVKVYHLLATLIGRDSDELACQAQAGFQGTADRLDEGFAFPLAVSLDALPAQEGRKEFALNQIGLTERIKLNIDAQERTNAVFTTFAKEPDQYKTLRGLLRKAIDPHGYNQADDLHENENIPALKVGDSINFCDGLAGQLVLAKPENRQALQNKRFTFPVFVGYPQQKSKAEVIGFVSGIIEHVNLHAQRGVADSITIRLLKNSKGAHSGPFKSTGDEACDNAMKLLSAASVKLLATDNVKSRLQQSGPQQQ